MTDAAHTPRPTQHVHATLRQVAAALRATLPQGVNEDQVVTSVSTDSRDVPSQSVFFALVGEKFDGHTFLEQLPPGVALAVVQPERVVSTRVRVPLLAVPDTLVALGDFARWHRDQFAGPVVAITGSAGKTTTKELTARVLAAHGPVLKTEGNLNNRIGVPLTIFGLSSQASAAVIEAGISLPGEMAALRKIIAPTIRVVLNAALAHVQFLKNEAGVAAEKAQLLDDAKASDVLVFNADDARIADEAAKRKSGRKISFGRAAGATVRATDIESLGERGTRFRLSHEGVSAEVTLPLIGEHHVLNALAATAVGLATGLSLDVVAGALTSARLEMSGRSRVIPLANGALLIDDTYNSNPQSASAAIAALCALAQKTSHGTTLAILGDMLELGDSGPNAHREIGNTLAAAGVTHVLTFGPLSQYTAETAQRRGIAASHVRAFTDKALLITDALATIDAKTCVLVKGSRGMRMEDVVNALTRQLTPIRSGERN